MRLRWPRVHRQRASAGRGWALLTPTSPTSVREVDRTVLVRDGRLLAVLDLHTLHTGWSTAASALESLRTAPAGIVVDEIDWWMTDDGRTARTGVVLALDPTVNACAIRARGGDTIGAVRMIRIVADRASILLLPHGDRLRLLDPTDAFRLLRSERCQPVGPAGSAAGRTARVSAVRARSAAGAG